MTEQDNNPVTSTQLTDMDSTIIKDAISDLNDLCERDRVKPGIQSILKVIADNLAGILSVKTMAHPKQPMETPGFSRGEEIGSDLT